MSFAYLLIKVLSIQVTDWLVSLDFFSEFIYFFVIWMNWIWVIQLINQLYLQLFDLISVISYESLFIWIVRITHVMWVDRY